MNALHEAHSEPLPWLPERSKESHKGNFGLALLVGGSQGMAGAISLTGMAALRGGAGLVRLAVPDVCLAAVAGFDPSYMTVALPSDRKGRISIDARALVTAHAAEATVVGCGPGMGRSFGLNALIGWLYTNLAKPMVIDADGLNALAARPYLLGQPAGPRILTPHPGEFARLLGQRRVAPEERQRVAVEMAKRFGAIIVLKTHESCVTDGRRCTTNTTGNPGLATGGTGDVLTGLIASLTCQGLSPFDAATLGVHLHGLAGDLAAAELGQQSMTARDLIQYLPAAFREYREHAKGSR
jgi:NAD(P)H-hydrate epimerase